MTDTFTAAAIGGPVIPLPDDREQRTAYLQWRERRSRDWRGRSSWPNIGFPEVWLVLMLACVLLYAYGAFSGMKAEFAEDRAATATVEVVSEP